MSAWTNKQVAFFAERWAAGDTYNQIADAMAERGWPVRDTVALATKRCALGLPSRWDKSAAQPKRPGRPRDDAWPAERTAMLRTLHAEGLSFTQIAKRLGCGLTRNAVIGRARRIMLPSIGKNENESAQRTKMACAGRVACQPAWSKPWVAPAPPKAVALTPKPAVRRHRRSRIADPSALIVEALLASACAAERRRAQYRAQPHGALRVR